MQGGGGDALARREAGAQRQVGAQDVEGGGDNPRGERPLAPAYHLAQDRLGRRLTIGYQAELVFRDGRRMIALSVFLLLALLVIVFDL